MEKYILGGTTEMKENDAGVLKGKVFSCVNFSILLLCILGYNNLEKNVLGYDAPNLD